MIEKEPVSSRQLSNGAILVGNNAVTDIKAYYCKELGWAGVESCNFEDCGYRESCEVERK